MMSQTLDGILGAKAPNGVVPCSPRPKGRGNEECPLNWGVEGFVGYGNHLGH